MRAVWVGEGSRIVLRKVCVEVSGCYLILMVNGQIAMTHLLGESTIYLKDEETYGVDIIKTRGRIIVQ